ncbi:MAG: hypothetical protein K8T89_19795 [Planctomycetes bacterium]|nr:hypothetical protein [Planctomycetota bacterium]
MARRIVCLSLAWIVVLAIGPMPRLVAQSPDSLRMDLGDGGRLVLDIQADEITTWEEQKQRVLALNGKVLISQGTKQVRADRAFIWIAIDERPEPGFSRGEIYATGNVQMPSSGSTESIPAVLLRFSSRGDLNVRGGTKIQKKSLADTVAYQTAVLARGAQPTPARLPVAVKPTESPYRPIVPVQNTMPVPRLDATAEPITVVLAPPALDPLPGAPGGSTTYEPPTFESPTIPLPNVSTRRIKIGNRSSNPTNAKYLNLGNGEQIALVTGGIKLLASFQDKDGLILDMEADQLVWWQKGNNSQDLIEAMRDDGVSQGNEKETEVYLSGNVVVRYGSNAVKRNADGSPTEDKILRADRVYYDLTRNRAIATNVNLEMISTDMAVPTIFRSDEIWQLSAQESKAIKSKAAASKLPGDPGLDMRMNQLTITEEKNQVRRTIFGTSFIDRDTGEEQVGSLRRFKARNSYLELGGVPVMWYPYLSGDVNDPLGPLENFVFRQDQIFGTQFLSTWSMTELIGIKKMPGERWDLMLDYLSERGPAAGMVYDLSAPKLFGFEAPFTTHVLAYGIYDQGVDQLAGPRSTDFVPSQFRGRVNWRHVQEYEDFSYQGQLAYLSDRNFLEQYYKNTFDVGPNEESFAYLKYQQGQGALTLLAQKNLDRYWVTETQWLPKLEGYWLGQSFFDRLTYNTWGSAGYANLQTFNLPANDFPSGTLPPANPFELPVRTGRFDWMHQLSMPIDAGAVKVVPYVVGDVAYYTSDVNGDSRGRLYGGAGARASMPLSRLYDGVQSEFLNLKGIYHKATLNGNYYNAYSDTPYNLLPQLDRLNDDATQQSIRDITPWQPIYLPTTAGNALATSPLYNPRLYAIRRLVDTRADTLDTVQVVQADLSQRWQTKRGYPGMEHTIDYITFDLSASYFPAYNRDNFGHPVSFIEYAGSWAVGDRNGFTSNGWTDPFAFGTRYWDVSTYYNRPDGTNFTLGYRHYNPVNSRLLFGSVSYVFSPKYSVAFNSAFDFGLQQNMSTGFTFTRTGTDLTWNVGFTYNALVKNFSFNFMVIPNLMASRAGSAGNLLNSSGNMMGRQ